MKLTDTGLLILVSIAAIMGIATLILQTYSNYKTQIDWIISDLIDQF